MAKKPRVGSLFTVEGKKTVPLRTRCPAVSLSQKGNIHRSDVVPVRRTNTLLERCWSPVGGRNTSSLFYWLPFYDVFQIPGTKTGNEIPFLGGEANSNYWRERDVRG